MRTHHKILLALTSAIGAVISAAWFLIPSPDPVGSCDTAAGQIAKCQPLDVHGILIVQMSAVVFLLIIGLMSESMVRNQEKAKAQ